MRFVMEGRRHSVDVPISKTIVALRRVRSLRDPSTNSMSKFPASVDNLHWETNSNNGISLQFMNGYSNRGSVDYGLLQSRNLGTCDSDDYDLDNGLTNIETNGTPLRNDRTEGFDCTSQNQDEICGNKSLSERCHNNRTYKNLELACISPSRNNLEDAASCHDSTVGPSLVHRVDNTASGQKYRYRYSMESCGPVDDIASYTDSTCLCKTDAMSSYSQTLYAQEEVGVTDRSHPRCGISCWSTPRLKDSSRSSDVEDCPLLSGDVGGITPGRRRRKNIYNDENQCSETPRSLSKKFRPKSFNELAGQDVIARSLLGAISNGRIASFYLFHGPRGTGKTSASRIFAAALNCLSIKGQRPCGRCQECVLFFSGRSRDVKEVDAVRINQAGRVKSLVKNAVSPPVSSRFKVFIIDECHLLHGETWATVLNGLDDFSQYVVFIMITPDLNKLPRSAVSRSQRYHFPKIKDAEISVRLGKICVEEGLDYEQVALDFIASKSNGSLRDAEMMLDQLTLFGKRITISLASEFIGIVSDDELLALLDLALSADTSNTVRRARELMRSRIDPMQLISQLANLTMDILAGNCQEGCSEMRRKFSERYASEADLQKLSHALKILSECEKQLRISKNQTTWLTVALLQLSSVESSPSNANDSKPCLRQSHTNVGDFCSASSTGGSPKHFLTCSCAVKKLCKLEIQEDCKGTLETIWRRTTELCQSHSLKKFLMKKGKLSSLCVNQGLAVADLEFHHPDHVSRAEKSWKLIARSLQSILGCNVELRINLVTCASVTKFPKARKLSFKLFSCARRLQQKSVSPTERRTESDYSIGTSGKPMMNDKPIETHSSCSGSQMSHNCYHHTEAMTTLRNSEGNVLVTSGILPNRPSQDDMLQRPEIQPNCFSRVLGLQKRTSSPDTSQMICSGIRPQNNPAYSIPRKTSFETNTYSSDCYVFCSSCNNNSSRDEQGFVSRAMNNKVHT